MEPFKITCVTCQAKLSVRNPSLIGQIVACPRCDSMVHVELPVEAAAAVPPQPTPPQPAEPAPVKPTRIVPPIAEPEVAVATVSEDAMALSEVPQVNPWIVKYKLLVWTLGAFVAGAAVAGAVLLFRGDSTKTEAAAPAIPQRKDVELPTETLKPNPQSVQDSTNTEIAAATKPVTTPTEPVTEQEAATTDKTEPDADETPVAIEPETQVKPTVEVARRFDPLDFDPESLDLTTIDSAIPKPTADEPPTADVSQTQDSEATTIPLPSTLPNVRRDPDQTVAPAIAEERLAQRFQSLKVDKIPLGDFLVLISRLAAVPISVGPEQLQMAGITTRRTVSLDATEVDLHEALRTVLDPLHLEVVVEGPLVRVVRQGGSKLREVNYPLSDLSSAASVDEIAAWVEQLIAPAEWQTVGGMGTLKKSSGDLQVNQAQWVQYRILIFLERYRLACGLLPRSRFPVQKLAGAPAYAQLAARLNSPTTFTFSRYTTLQDVVQYWQIELGVPILVDWPALANFDLWPQIRIVCSTIDKPWHVALSEILEPLGLGWRAVAGKTLEITTLPKVQTEPQLELYSLSRAPDTGADRMLAELAALAAMQSSNAATLEATAIEYDARAKVVLVRQPATVQRKIYEWLENNRLLLSD